VERDNIDVDISSFPSAEYIARYGNSEREISLRLRQFETWLKKKNIKYTLIRKPLWGRVTEINMRTEDAVVFKLVFGL
jgi:hypothetical protein